MLYSCLPVLDAVKSYCTVVLPLLTTMHNSALVGVVVLHSMQNHHHHHRSTALRVVEVIVFFFFFFFALKAAASSMDAWQLGNNNQDVEISLEHTCFEEYWQDLPSLVKTDHNADGGDDDDDGDGNHPVVLQIEGFSFLGRMAIYEFLMFGTDDALLWSDGDNDDDGDDDDSKSSSSNNSLSSSLLREHHWLWAYASQMDWQHRSGRLNLHQTRTNADLTDRISLDSWWGYMNFCFSVAILLGAEKSGLLLLLQDEVGFADNNNNKPQRTVVLEMDPATEMLVQQDIGVQASIDAWANLFQNGYATYKTNMMDLMRSTSGNTTTIAATSSTKKKNRRRRQEERFQLQQQVWEAHTAVIHNCMASPRFNKLLEKMPPAEQRFAMGWANMVEILAAGCFPTDLVTLLQDGAGFLPLQVLDDYTWSSLQDNAEQLEGLEKRRYTSIVATHDLVEMPPAKKRNIASFWKRISRNHRISRSLPRTIQKLYHGSPLVKLTQLIKLFGLFVRPREWIAVGAGLIGTLVVRLVV